jgi:predicted negative regulator of RcsB-dependent stress response
MGHHAEALAAFDTAIAIFERLHDEGRAARCQLGRALVLALLGRDEEARAAWATAERSIGAGPEFPGLRARLAQLLGGR